LSHHPYLKLTVIGLLILVGVSLELSGLLDVRELVAIAREYSQHWWLIIVLILLQALLFSFALAGSLFLWIAAPLYPPSMTTFILAIGGTLGGLGAYLLSRYLSLEWRQKIENTHGYRLLQSQDNFYTLFALRVFPAFPHAIINYSAGLLGARLSHFIIAALLGISIKSYLYAGVIHSASNELSVDLLLDFGVIGPLILLSLVSALAVYLNYRLANQHT
jgi:uncharacterized membrane protein YdjX (TVP38/TMEM64 family)